MKRFNFESHIIWEKPKNLLGCVTLYPLFEGAVLNRWNLDTTWRIYKLQVANPYEGPQHMKRRHIGYIARNQLSTGGGLFPSNSKKERDISLIFSRGGIFMKLSPQIAYNA